MSVGQNSYFSEFTFHGKSKIGPLFPPRSSSKSRPSLIKGLQKETGSLQRSASSVNYDQFKGKQNKQKSFINLSQEQSVKSSLFNDLQVIESKPAEKKTPQRAALGEKKLISYQNNSEIKQIRQCSPRRRNQNYRPHFKNHSPPYQPFRTPSQFYRFPQPRLTQSPGRIQPSRSRSPFQRLFSTQLRRCVPHPFMPINSQYFGGFARADISMRRQRGRSLSIMSRRFQHSRRGHSGLRYGRRSPRFF